MKTPFPVSGSLLSKCSVFAVGEPTAVPEGVFTLTRLVTLVVPILPLWSCTMVGVPDNDVPDASR